MNIRGKSSPIQSNIRAAPNPTRGHQQTPPPASQLRGGHFDDPSAYQAHFQAAGAAYQQSQPAVSSRYIDMSKPATGRVAGGPGLAQAPQGFNVQRGQHPAYNLVGDNQDQQGQQMWNPQPGPFFIPNQNIRQRMPAAMNNSQVAFMSGMPGNMANMAFLPGNIGPSYSGNQALPFVPPSSQFVPYSQPRMPYNPLTQQQQMGFMQQYPPSTAYAPTAYYPTTQMQMHTNRSSSSGPPSAMGPKPPRNRKMLSLTDPTTGEDITEKVFKSPGGEDPDPTVLESQAHREAVHLEFATKVAFLAKDKHPSEGSHAIPITAPPPQPPPPAAPSGPEAPSHPAVMEEPQAASLGAQDAPPHSVVAEQPPVPVVNGEPETNIQEQALSAQTPAAATSSYSTAPAEEEFEPSPPQSVETVAAAPDTAQTPSPALPAAPAMPEVAAPVNVVPKPDMAAPPSRVEVSPSPPAVETAAAPVVEQSPPPPVVVEKAPAAVPEKEPTPPVESVAVVPPSGVSPVQSTSVSAADAAKIITETAVPPALESQPPAASAQASTSQPEPSAPEVAQPSTSQAAQPQPSSSQAAPAQPSPQGGQPQAVVPPQPSPQAAPAQPSTSPAPEPQPASSQAAQPQASQAQQPPQPQRDGRKSGRKHKRELNKKRQEGSEMDAFIVGPTEATQQENAGAAPSDSPKTTPSASPPPVEEAPCPAESAPEPVAPESPAPEPVAPEPEAVPEPPASAPEAVEKPRQGLLPDPEPPVNHVDPEPQPAVIASDLPEEAAAAESSAPRVPEVEVVEVTESASGDEMVVVVEGKENGELTETDLKEIQKRMESCLGLRYEDGKWSPSNQEGKKQYGRDFLLRLQGNPESRKPPELPHMQELMVDPRTKTEDFQRAQMAASRNVPDFTPGFFKSFPRGPVQSLTKRNSQQRGRGGPGSQTGEQQQQRIIISTRQEVQLHKSSNAYKPHFQQAAAGAAAGKSDEEQSDSEILRKFQAILNKVTPEKFVRLGKQATEMKLNTISRLTGIADLIFEKAISEQKFAGVYANLCKELIKVPKVVDENGKEATFRAILLTKCQREFEKDKDAESELDDKMTKLKNDSSGESKAKMAEVQEDIKKARHRSMGNIRFIGELFHLKMLTENIMHDCIFKLLKQRDDESIECLTKLLDTIGHDLDHTKAKGRMDQYFYQMEKMVADMRPGEKAAPSSTAKGKEQKLSSRVKFGVLDILDLRSNNWVKRRIHDSKPATLDVIHQKAKEEEQAVQYMLSQPRQQDPPGARGGARPKGSSLGGRGSSQNDDGWSTVPARPVKQSIEPTRMKLTKQPPVDLNNVTLGGGNKFSNWCRGSQGGGSHSQEQERQGNRYTALNNLSDSDNRRGYGRSPARGDGGRGSGRLDRDHERRDRDYRRPPARASMEEKERAVTNTRNMLGAGRDSSNPDSRSPSRDNTRSSDIATEVAAKKGPGIDTSKMSPDELDRRINTITEELILNKNLKDTQESIQELRNLDQSMLVTSMLEKVLEKTPAGRKLLGQFLYHLVCEKQISIENIIKGIAGFLEVCEDLELDVPKVWDYTAEMMGGLVVDNKILPLNFLQACLQTLVTQGNKKEGPLLTMILKQAADAKGKELIQAQWAASGLKLTDFGLSGAEVPWLKAHKRIYEEVLERLQRRESNEEIFQWIDRTFSKEEKESNQFARELFSAICCNSIEGKKTANVGELKKRAPLVRKYLGTQEKGTQALFGVQLLMCELEHPQGLVRTLFEAFYDEDMISEDSFFDWEAREGPPEDCVGKGVVLMNVRAFFDWLRTSNEEEKAS